MNERIEELKKELEELKTKKFFNDMIDRWTNEDREFDNWVTNEIRRVQKEIEALEKLLDK